MALVNAEHGADANAADSQSRIPLHVESSGRAFTPPGSFCSEKG